MTIGQAPTTKINGYWCRDSIAESKVIDLDKRLVKCDTAVSQALRSIDRKNAKLDNVLKQNYLLEQERNVYKKKYKKMKWISVVSGAVIFALGFLF